MTQRQNTTSRIGLAVPALATLALVAFGAVSLTWFAEGRADTSVVAKAPPLRVAVRRMEASEQITRHREFMGDITAARESQVSFERPGRIVIMWVDEGDHVTAGQILATIDVDQTAANLNAAKAELDQANAVLSEFVRAWIG